MRRALRPGKRGAAGKRGRPLARHAPHVRGEPGAKPFVDDLLLGRGFVRSRAAPSLRSIESQPSTQGFVAPGADAATVAAAVVGGGVPRPARSASVRPSRSSSLFPSHPSAPRVAPPCPSPAKGSGGWRFSHAASRGRPRRAGRSRGRLRVPLRPVGARGKEGESGRAPPGAAPRASATRLASSSASPRRRAFPGPAGLGRGEGEWWGEVASRRRGGGERWRAGPAGASSQGGNRGAGGRRGALGGLRTRPRAGAPGRHRRGVVVCGCVLQRGPRVPHFLRARGVDQLSRPTRARVRGPAGSTSCPGRLGPGSVWPSMGSLGLS